VIFYFFSEKSWLNGLFNEEPIVYESITCLWILWKVNYRVRITESTKVDMGIAYFSVVILVKNGTCDFSENVQPVDALSMKPN